ncbi:MAG: hypothetical protein LBU31_00260 [Coriobacteriales bacterium]|jgi:hypothetical protein|nr:hypothetical protein [Coriobacteriales bacterium]
MSIKNLGFSFYRLNKRWAQAADPRLLSMMLAIVLTMVLAAIMLPALILEADADESEGAVLAYHQNAAPDDFATYEVEVEMHSSLDLLTADEAVAAPVSFECLGHTLVGWNTEPDGSGDPHELGGPLAVESSDIDLYAVWAPRTDIVIAYEPGAGSGIAFIDTDKTYGAPYTVRANDPEASDPEANDPEASGSEENSPDASDPGASGSEASSPDSDNLDAEDPNPDALNPDDPDVIDPDPDGPSFKAPADYEFDCWLGSDANSYAPGDTIDSLTLTDLVLTAQWKLLTPPKTPDLSDTPDQPVPLESPTAPTPSAPSTLPDGHTSSLGGSVQAGATFTVSDRNVTLVAVGEEEKTAVSLPKPKTPAPDAPANTPAVRNMLGAPSQVAPLASAAREQGIPVLDILGQPVSLISPSGYNAWPLFNLICTMGGITALTLVGVCLLVPPGSHESRRKGDALTARLAARLAAEGVRADRGGGHFEDNAERTCREAHAGLLVATAFATATGVILFMLTQDVTLPMVLFDAWSIASGVLLLACILCARLAFTKSHRPNNSYRRPLPALPAGPSTPEGI